MNNASQAIVASPDSTPCPMCDQDSNGVWSKFGHQLFECNQCGHLFCLSHQQADYVDETYGDEYFQGADGGYSNYLENQHHLKNQGRKYSQILNKHHSQGRLLDVGSAAGFMLKGFVDDGWIGTGIEPNRSMHKHASQQLKLDIHHGTFDSYASDQPFDAITIVQVLSHLPDPRSALEKANRLLRTDGLLLIETWNRKSLTARLFGRKWHQYNPPSVLHWYTRNELSELLQKSGFEVIQQGRPTKWISIGNGAALLRHSMRESLMGRIATAPLKLVPQSVKVPYFLDDVFWVVAKKSN